MKDFIRNQDKNWSLIDILLIVVIVFGGKNVVYKLLKVIFNWELFSPILPFILHLVQSLLLIILTLGLVIFKYNCSLTDFGLKEVKSVKNINYGLVGGFIIWLLITLFNNFFYSIIAELFYFKPPTQQAINSLLGAKNLFLFIIHSLLIVIIAPITEEIFFRGFIYPYCKNKLGTNKGIIISSVVFGLAHANFWIFFPTFIGGIILTLIYERTNSLYSPMIAHSTWNGIVIFLVYILWEIGG